MESIVNYLLINQSAFWLKWKGLGALENILSKPFTNSAPQVTDLTLTRQTGDKPTFHLQMSQTELKKSFKLH